MMLTFILTWSPFVVVYFLPLIGVIKKESVTTSDVVPVLTIKLGCTIMNPLVYVFQEPEVRNDDELNLVCVKTLLNDHLMGFNKSLMCLLFI